MVTGHLSGFLLMFGFGVDSDRISPPEAPLFYVASCQRETKGLDPARRSPLEYILVFCQSRRVTARGLRAAQPEGNGGRTCHGRTLREIPTHKTN